jgi:hypothetical protein
VPDFQQMARRLAPLLVTITEGPFWVSVCRPPESPGAPPAEAVVEFWLGPGFDDWYPGNHCIAIFAVVPGRASGGSLPPVLRDTGLARGPGCLVYGVSDEGEAYAATGVPAGPLVELEVRGGRLFDVMRTKFGLPPGPPSVYDLEMCSSRDRSPVTCEPAVPGSGPDPDGPDPDGPDPDGPEQDGPEQGEIV